MNNLPNKDLKYILIYPTVHESLGLYRDLQEEKNVQLIISESKVFHNKYMTFLKKIHHSKVLNDIFLVPFKEIWYRPIDIKIKSNEDYCIIVDDAALLALNVRYLNQIFGKPNVRGILILLNSMDADSRGIKYMRNKINRVKWSDIYTFDPQDAQKYQFKNLGTCYYSKSEQIFSNSNSWDAYYVGSLKGNRNERIFDLFASLQQHGINSRFDISISSLKCASDYPFSEEINYHNDGWIPYEEVLAKTQNSNVIVEILQEGQYGPSLRYYEAVCYNKKLLTTNERIKNLPFYNSQFMKVFNTIDDIDFDWIHRKEKIEYHYDDEFSPKHLLEIVLS